MRINDFRAILNNDETARHLNACWQCKEDKEIMEHTFNFFMFLMGDFNPLVESRTEREDKLKQIQKKITTRILDIHYAYFAPHKDFSETPIVKSGFDNFDIGKLNSEMALYGKLTPKDSSDFNSGPYFTKFEENN